MAMGVILCVDCGRPEANCRCQFEGKIVEPRYCIVSDGMEYTVFDRKHGVDLFPTVADSRGARHGMRQGKKCDNKMAVKIADAMNRCYT